MQNLDLAPSFSLKLALKFRDYLQLIKFTLSFTVVFSTVICYLLGYNSNVNPLFDVLLLTIAGLLVTGSANAFNQVLERKTDGLMSRTKLRPVADGRMSPFEGYSFAIISFILGFSILYFHFNSYSAILSLFSLILYSFVYTPLKKVNSIAVLVGAFPGAFPCLIGWVAATNSFSIIGWILFLIQFIWQFPHFWAIAWVTHKDYTSAGFKLLPSNSGPTKFTALQCVMYSFLMIPIGILPAFYGICGDLSLFICLIANVIMVILSLRLYLKMDLYSAKVVMFSSYIYLPIVYLSLIFDKTH